MENKAVCTTFEGVGEACAGSIHTACNWIEELTDLENRTADAIVRLKVVKAALDGIMPDMVRRPEYDMLAGCSEIIGEAVDMLEGR